MSGKYLAARDAFGAGELAWAGDAISARLMSAAYAFDERHRTTDDLEGAVGDPIAVLNPHFSDGWARCDALKFSRVTGSEAIAVVFYRESDGLLIEYHTAIDSFPMMLNGCDIELAVAEPGIFRL